MKKLFQPADASPSIRKMLAMSRFKQFRAGQIIVHQGTISEEVYLVIKGSVTVESYDDQGQRLVFHYIRPGEFFGEMGMFDDDLRRSATVVARAHCEIAVVEIGVFRSLIEEDASLLMELARQLAERVRKTTEKLTNLAFLDVTGRVARTVLELAEDEEAMSHPDGTLISITREELGRMVNCSREMAGQVLKTLEERGLINLEGRKIVVLSTRSTVAW
ncbi:MAG: CRP/FNR family cyclic AMP-dependent transcriptional regulator [Parasphingorhabdus sp.]|jgi:CRP/FNR family cyclic AMP-dependent transcriptional regulator